MRIDEERRPYISYLLRLRRVRRWDRWIWRASLESPDSGTRTNFPDLDSLFAFLEAQTRAETPEAGPDLEAKEDAPPQGSHEP